MNTASIEDLKRHFDCDPDAGTVLWKKPTHHLIKAGDVAGTVEKRGYRIIHFKKKAIKAHRLIWAFSHGYFPDGEIDHIDGNPSNNKISNLRVVDRSKNQMNQGLQKNNKSGIKGVHFCNGKGKWVAKINCDKNRLHLGCFDSIEEAAEKRFEAEKVFHGQYARKCQVELTQ